MVEIINKNSLGNLFRDRKEIKAKINKTVSLDEDSFRMVKENEIENFSRYINELIRENLAVYESKDAKRILCWRVEELRKFAKNNNLKMEINLE